MLMGEADPTRCSTCGLEVVGRCTTRCRRLAASRKWHAANREQDRGHSRRWRLGNPKRAAELVADWGRRHPEKLRERTRRYRAAHPEKDRAWKAANVEKARAWSRRWKANNPEKVAELWGRRKARMLQGGARAVSRLDLLALLETQGGRCFYCSNWLTKKHLDHKTPLVLGGRHELSNLVWACPSCNLKKRAKTADEFMRGTA